MALLYRWYGQLSRSKRYYPIDISSEYDLNGGWALGAEILVLLKLWQVHYRVELFPDRSRD